MGDVAGTAESPGRGGGRGSQDRGGLQGRLTGAVGARPAVRAGRVRALRDQHPAPGPGGPAGQGGQCRPPPGDVVHRAGNANRNAHCAPPAASASGAGKSDSCPAHSSHSDATGRFAFARPRVRWEPLCDFAFFHCSCVIPHIWARVFSAFSFIAHHAPRESAAESSLESASNSILLGRVDSHSRMSPTRYR